MKEKIIRAVVSGVVGIMTSIVTIYLGASATETIVVSGVASSGVGTAMGDGLRALVS